MTGITLQPGDDRHREDESSRAPLYLIYLFVTTWLVPAALAIVVVFPIGLLILPFFIPKFIRTARLRRHYGVRRRTDDTLTRIERTTPRGFSGGGTVPLR